MAHSLIQRTHLLLVLLVFLCRSSADSKGTPKLIREKRDPSFKVVAARYSVDLDCRFKDPHSLDSVTLSKVSTGKQTPRIVDGVKISKSGQIFTINDFQKSDEGRYWCKLGSWSYRIESLYVVSRTQPGNYILTQSTVPENITTINEGDNVTIVCKVSGNGIKRVEWYKDKKELPSRYNNTADFNVSIADLTAVTVAQAGEYECRTSIIPTPYFGYQAESFVLQVIGFHFLAKNKKYQRLFVGDKVTINCNTNVQKATSTLWVRKDIRPSKQVMPNGSTITRKGNSFLLSSLTQDDAGSYVCKATSSLLEKTIEEEITTLLIFTDDQGKPLAQVYPVVGEVFSGQNVNISCQAPGNAVSMEWSRKGQIVSSIQTHRKIRKTAKGYFTESTLVLTNVSKVDNGTYTCTVTTSQNMGYSNQATATLLVTECHESYKFADPSDTSGYFECKHGTPVKKSCPGNHVWNQEDKKCKLWQLDWVHDKDGKRVVILDTNTPFELDCQLNDPRVTVTVTVQLKKGNQNVDSQNDSSVTQIGQKFRIDVSSLSSGHSMELKCQALGSGGVSEKTVTLLKAKDFQNNVFVQFLPVCSPGPLAIHDSISIICHAYHFGDMGWYKIDKSSNVRKAISDSDPRLTYDKRMSRHGHWNKSKTLTLDNVTKNDEGAYVCWKSNGYNITKNITIYIDVADLSPATIEKLDSPPQSFIKEGQNARFHCTVSGSPRPNVTWKRGQEIVAFCAGKYNGACETFGSRYKANWRDDRGCMRSYSMGPTSGGWVSWLNVNNLQYPADVKYTCVVENSRGKEEKVASLKIAVAPVLQGNTNNGPEKVYGVQDREEEIKCITERSNPPATFKWRYQPLNCSFSSSSCPKPTNNWIKLTQFGEIKNRSDNMSVLILPGYLKNMYFKCIAENPVTGAKDSKQYQFMRLTGEVSSFLNVKPEPFMTKSEGSNITLRCEASIGYFMGWPSWNFKGKTFDTNSENRKYVNRFEDMNRITELIIRDAKPSDRGRYVCSARTKLEDGKELRKSIRLTMIAFSKPNVNISANLTRLKKGQAAELSCNVTGNPSPEISWFRNGEKIQTENTIGLVEDCKQRKSGFYKIKDEEVEKYGVLESRLVVCSAAHLNHTGSYTCEASNSIGNDMATAYVNILEKPSVTVIPPWEVESGITELNCTATGNPTPLIYWEKQESEGSSFVPVQGQGGQGMKNVNVIRVKKGSEDLYRCVANNSEGSDSKETKQILSGPDVDYVKRQNDGGISKESTIVMITCVGFVVIVFFLLCLILYKRKKRYGGFYLLTLPPSPDYIMKLDPERSLLEQTNKLPYDAQWEFPRERVHIAKPLGSGAFGQVFLAQATGIVAFDPRGSTKRKPGRRRSRFGSTSRPYYNDKRVTAVAVKSLKDNATEAEYRDLLSELKILIHIGEHKNIVNLLGACTKGMERELWVIIEYCPHGNLLDFLRKRRDIFEPVWTTPTEHADVTFSTIDLYICSLQVARAMEFLASRRCVHRDLAARNVLVGENYVLKVADFGLARDIYKEEHYVKTTAGLLPVKWMAIEALVDRIYTHKSDVWSFGVLLWELFTLGGSPYPGLPANEVYQYLMEGQRMDNPLNCPDEMYEIMRNCWDHSPDERPSFTDLVARIDKLLEDRTSESGEGYLDLEHAEDEPNLDEPTFEDEYLDPGQTLLPSPGSPTSEERMNYPLPPLPSEEIEMGTFEEPIKDEEKKKFVLLDPPREKRIARMDSELEKVRKDTLEREKPKDSVGHYNEDEFISEKEQLRSDDDDKDICERNSGVFEFSPDYEARHSHSLDVPPQENAYYGEQRPPSQGEVTFKAGNGFRGRQPSNRYVNS